MAAVAARQWFVMRLARGKQVKQKKVEVPSDPMVGAGGRVRTCQEESQISGI